MRGRLLAIAATAVVVAVFAAAAIAAPVPGTPVAVAPGVPGHGRGWELVTPRDTIAARIGDPRAISASGDRFVFTSWGVLPQASEGKSAAENLAVRGATGWAITPLPSVGEIPLLGSAVAAASDASLSTQVWASQLPEPDEGSAGVGLFRGAPTAPELLLDLGEVGEFDGASEDLRTLVFSSDRHLLPADASRTEGRSVYALSDSGLSLVDVDDLGMPLSPCGSRVPADPGSNWPGSPGVVSRDGSRIFFVSPPPESLCPEPPRVYLREGEATTEISASRCTRPDCNGPQEAYFAGATPDGSQAFIVTTQQLTNDDEDSISDLYRYDLAGGDLTRISTPRPPGFPPGGAEHRAVQVSADGSRVYFSFVGRLVPVLGNEGGSNVYLADQEGLHFVYPGGDTGRLSEDGRYLAYAMSTADGDEQADVYRYDAVTGSHEQISAGPTGGSGPFGASLDAISADGRRVFFTTGEQLVAADRNEAEDVYEWWDGDLALVSAGSGDAPTSFGRLTPDGRTAVILTGSTLLPSDRDGGDRDLYAAPVGGGFPEPPQGGEDCETGACRPEAAASRVARPEPGADVPRRIGLVRPGRAAIRRIVASGRLTVRAEVPAAGLLRASARARIDGRSRLIATGSRRVDAAGPVRLLLPLSPAARQSLARGDGFRARLELRLTGLRPAASVSFSLGGADR